MKKVRLVATVCLFLVCSFNLAAVTRHLVDGLYYFDPDFRGAVVTFNGDKYPIDEAYRYAGDIVVPQFVELPAPRFLSSKVAGSFMYNGKLTSDGSMEWIEERLDYTGWQVAFCGDSCPVLRVFFIGNGSVEFFLQANGGGTLSWGELDKPFDGQGGSLKSDGGSNFVEKNVIFNVNDDRVHFVEFSGTALPEINTELRVYSNAQVENAEGKPFKFEVYKVGDSAFRGCKSLISLSLPASIESIEYRAISFWEKLKTLTIMSPTMPSIEDGAIFMNSTLEPKPTLYVPEELVESYQLYKDYFDIQPVVVPKLNYEEILPAVGSEVQLTVGENANAIWSSSDPTVATVDETGLVKALKIGHCTINVSIGGNDLVCNVMVMPYEGVRRDEDGSLMIDELVIADATAYDSPYDIKVGKLTYTRTFGHTGWHALYVPFDMSYDEWTQYGDVAQFNDMHQYDQDGDGVREVTVVEFNLMHSGSIKPNTPYVFRPKAATQVEFACNGKSLSALPEQPVTLECSSTSIIYTMAGTYQPMTGEQTQGIYCLSGGEFKRVASGATLSPMRIYITMAHKENAYDDNAKVAMPSRIGLSIDGEEAGIADAIVSATDEDAPIYDLTGRPVVNPGPGIYIRGGKKILIKQ